MKNTELTAEQKLQELASKNPPSQWLEKARRRQNDRKPIYCENNFSNMVCKALALNTGDFERKKCSKCYYYNKTVNKLLDAGINEHYQKVLNENQIR